MLLRNHTLVIPDGCVICLSLSLLFDLQEIDGFVKGEAVLDWFYHLILFIINY